MTTSNLKITKPVSRRIADPETGEISQEWETQIKGLFDAIAGPFPLRQFTVATMPDPVRYAWCLIAVTDASGTPCVAISNGTNWKRLDYGATVT